MNPNTLHLTIQIPNQCGVFDATDTFWFWGPRGLLKRERAQIDPTGQALFKIDETHLSFLITPGVHSTQDLKTSLERRTIEIFNHVHAGVFKELQMVGVGYRIEQLPGYVMLKIGLSHLMPVKIPSTVRVRLPNPTKLIVFGIDPVHVGEFAADVRSRRPPEIYKGKGIRYAEEIVKLKVGKKK